MPYPNIAPSIIAFLSIAWARAFLTFKLLNGSILLFVERIVSPSFEPIKTLNLESASNCTRFSGAGKLLNTSTSSAIIAAKAADGSDINLNVAFSNFAGAPQ